MGVNDLGGSAERAAAQLGDNALAVPADVTDAQQVRDMVARVGDHFANSGGRWGGSGAVDTVVNNAGILFTTRISDITEDEWRATLDVNLTGAFLVTQAALPDMRSAGFGRIVNVASTAGKTVSTLGGAHYTASKHGLLGLTRAVAREVAADGVTVNAVCPGLIDTEMARENASAERIAAYAESFPVGRLGTATEVAHAVSYLVSAEASYITGAAMDVNGGGLMV